MILIVVEEREKAFGFIKSRKSESIVMDITKQIYKFADQKGLDLQNVQVDRKGSYDYDRPEINEMMVGLETDQFSVILLRDINDITRDPEQQEEFLRQVKDFGGIVVSVTDGAPIRLCEDEC